MMRFNGLKAIIILMEKLDKNEEKILWKKFGFLISKKKKKKKIILYAML